MFKNSIVKVGVAALTLAISHASMAAVTAEEAAKLGKDLTPFGGEMKGNSTGTIPEWKPITKADIPADYKKSGQHHPDPFAQDKPLFVIDADNYSQYKDQLTAGQIALFKAYPKTFKMPIYQSRRTHSAPDWVAQNTKLNATTATLAKDGNGIENAFGGIPFPAPQNALEVLWNHIVRWRGQYVVRDGAEVAVQSNGKYVVINSHTEVDFKYYEKGGNFKELDNMIFYFLSTVKTPARLAGQATLVHEKLNQTIEPRQAWLYAAGLRRVRRAPNLAFDAPINESEGLRTADDTDMYNGSPTRYNWKLVGKKEMYIPYNNYRIDNPNIKYADLLLTGHVNPEYTRYELHRVWVVEGQLKEGERHIYSKRTAYIDEDSWGIAVLDQYNGRGDLWRVSMAYLKNYYEVPVTWTALDVYHDLDSKRYHVQMLDNEEPSTLVFNVDSPDVGNFQPSALRRLGKR